MYGSKKTPKSQQPDKQLLLLHKSFQSTIEAQNLDDYLLDSLKCWSLTSDKQAIYHIKDRELFGPETLIITSIDPGVVNLGFRIEARHSNGTIDTLVHCRLKFSKKKSAAQRKQSSKSGTTKPSKPKKNPTQYSIQQPETLDKFLELEKILYERAINESSDCHSDIYDQISMFLDIYLYLLKKSHFIVIEKQLPENYMTVRFSQHVISYLLFKVYNTPDSIKNMWIAEIDCKLKSRLLDCPKNLNKSYIKKWLIEKAISLCKSRNDEATYQIISKAKKQDDLADTICQTEAFCVMMHLPLTVEQNVDLSVPTVNIKANKLVSIGDTKKVKLKIGDNTDRLGETDKSSKSKITVEDRKKDEASSSGRAIKTDNIKIKIQSKDRQNRNGK